MSLENVTIGDIVLTEADVGREAQYHPAGNWEEARHQAQRALVVRELLLLECLHRGIVEERPKGERDSQAAIARLLEEVIPSPVDDDACRAFFETHPEKFRSEPLFAVSHILLGVTAGDREGRATAKQRAAELLDRLQREPERFESIAKSASACPSAQSGGHLGQVSPGETEPAFEAAVRATSPGSIHPQLVETRHGYHVVRVDAQAAGRPLPFEAVSERIRVYLGETAFRRELRHLLLALAEKHGLQGFDLESKAPAPMTASRGGPRRLPLMR